jgi:DNA-binding CsgD family transcriptional regulator
MATENTRRAVRRELEEASRSGLQLEAFTRRTLSLLRRAVPFDACCFATVDPTTSLITSAVADGLDEARAPRLFEIEYARGDVNGYRSLARDNVRAVTLHAATAGDPARSSRFAEVLRPLGLAHELRVLFSSEGQTWGVAALLRETSEHAFDEDEVRMMSSLSETIAEGVRGSILVEVAGRAPPAGGIGPAVIVVDPRDEIEVVTPAASARLDDFPQRASGRLPSAILVAVAAARAAGSSGARLRVRGRSGAWWLVSATTLESQANGRAKVVATIEEARTAEVVPLVVAALGLSPRERDVLIGVLEGQTSVEVADALGISSHTVNDHLKSIFGKADVRSRRELVARIFFEQYAPRLGAPLGPSGWFVE